MALQFESFDFKQALADEPDEPESPGLLRHAADTGLQLAQGVLQGGEMLANTFGADNQASQALRAGAQWLASNFSDQLKWEQLTAAQDARAAELSGSTWEEIKAAARAMGADPVGFLFNAAGTTLPTIAAALLPGGQGAVLGRLAATSFLGAAQGTGAVKGQIYGTVEDAWKKAGASDEEAQARATAAQEYLGSSAGQIALGGALGAVAVVGLEAGIIARRAMGAAGQAAATATAIPTASILSRAAARIPRFAKEGIKEALPEGAQGGQEQLASNLALQNEGFDQSTFGGVAGAVTLESMAGGSLGAAASPLTAVPESRQRAADRALDDLTNARSADEAIDAALRAVDVPIQPGDDAAIGSSATPRQSNIDAIAEIRQLPRDQQEVAIGLLATIRNPRAPDGVRRSAINQFDGLLLPYRQPAQPGEATEILPIGEATELEDIPVGEATELPMSTVVDGRRLRTPQEIADEGRPPAPIGQASEIDIETVEPAPALDYEPLSRKGTLRTQDIDPAAPNAVRAYVERMRGTNTLQARAFVREYEAGRLTDADVLALMVPPRQESAQDRIEAAASQAPRPLSGLIDPEGVIGRRAAINAAPSPSDALEEIGSNQPAPAPEKPRRNSEQWRNEGKTPDDLRAEKVQSLASELAGQIAVEASEKDFAPNEIQAVVRQWAKDDNVPADELRQALLKEVGRTGISDARKLQVRRALDPTRAPAAPAAPAGDLMTVDGKPYGTKAAATIRARKEGGEVVEVDGGWVVRMPEGRQPQAADAQSAEDVVRAHRREFGKMPSGMTRDEFRAFHDRRRAAEADVARKLLQFAEDGDGLLMPSKGNGFVALHKDPSKEGAWRTTYFTKDMEPSGHMEYASPEEAANSFRTMVAADTDSEAAQARQSDGDKEADADKVATLPASQAAPLPEREPLDPKRVKISKVPGSDTGSGKPRWDVQYDGEPIEAFDRRTDAAAWVKSATEGFQGPSGAVGRQGVKHPRTVMGSTFLAAISRDLGGLDPAWLSEFSTRFETAIRDKRGRLRLDKKGRPRVQWRNPLIPGIGYLFRAGGTQDLQELAELAEAEGYLEPGSVAADYKEAGERAKRLIQDALNRRELQHVDDAQAEREASDEADRQAWYEEVNAEAAADLEAERQAIMAEAELTDDGMAALIDSDLAWDTQGDDDQAALMRALGFTEQEIDDELADKGPRADQEEAAGVVPARPGEGQAAASDRGPAPRDRGQEEDDRVAGADAKSPTSRPDDVLNPQAPADLEAKAERAEDRRIADADRTKRAKERGALMKRIAVLRSLLDCVRT
jgi:hypothetical protein